MSNSEKYLNLLSHPSNLPKLTGFSNFVEQSNLLVWYIAILNLPRDERYTIENIILSGIILGPKEPKLIMNPLLFH